MSYRRLHRNLAIATVAAVAVGVVPSPGSSHARLAANESASAPAGVENLGLRLNLAGRQRMLTQRMSKEAFLVAAGIDPAANRERLAESIRLFDTTLAGLRNGDTGTGLRAASHARIASQLDDVRARFDRLREPLDRIASGGAPTREDLARIAGENRPLLKSMARAVKMEERAARTRGLSADPKAAVEVNLAGRQRMLTQRIAKEVVQMHLGLGDDEVRLDLRESVYMFEATLDALMHGDEVMELPGRAGGEIRERLDSIHENWLPFAKAAERAWLSDSVDAGTLATIVDRNVPLLKAMHEVVGMIADDANTKKRAAADGPIRPGADA